jgi:hypothetical protein
VELKWKGLEYWVGSGVKWAGQMGGNIAMEMESIGLEYLVGAGVEYLDGAGVQWVRIFRVNWS